MTGGSSQFKSCGSALTTCEFVEAMLALGATEGITMEMVSCDIKMCSGDNCNTEDNAWNAATSSNVVGALLTLPLLLVTLY